MDSNLLNTAEAARFLRVSEASIRRWSDSGLLPARRVGRRRERRFAESELLKFLDPGTTPRPSAHQEIGIRVGGVQLRTPSHLATYYSSDAGALRLSLPFLAAGPRLGQPCFLVASGAVLKHYVDALSKQGVDFKAAIDRGQFTIVHFEGGTAAAAVTYWERSFGAALSSGATVIRVVGEMISERAMFTSESEMLRYEETFEVMFKRYPGVVLCQYDVREFGGEAILRSLKAHPDLFGLRLGGFLH